MGGRRHLKSSTWSKPRARVNAQLGLDGCLCSSSAGGTFQPIECPFNGVGFPVALNQRLKGKGSLMAILADDHADVIRRARP